MSGLQVTAEWGGRLFAATVDAYGTAVVTGLPIDSGAGDEAEVAEQPGGSLNLGQNPRVLSSTFSIGGRTGCAKCLESDLKSRVR
jgi:hypothetical protein